MKNKSLKRCNKSTNKLNGKTKRRKPKKKSRSRKMRGGSNPNVLELGQGSKNLNLLKSNFNTAAFQSKYQFHELNKFTKKISFGRRPTKSSRRKLEKFLGRNF